MATLDLQCCDFSVQENCSKTNTGFVSNSHLFSPPDSASSPSSGELVHWVPSTSFSESHSSCVVLTAGHCEGNGCPWHCSRQGMPLNQRTMSDCFHVVQLVFCVPDHMNKPNRCIYLKIRRGLTPISNNKFNLNVQPFLFLTEYNFSGSPHVFRHLICWCYIIIKNKQTTKKHT